MNPTTKKYIMKICLVLVLVAGFYVFKYFTQDITIRVENNSNTNIHDLHIEFRGGEIEVLDLTSTKAQTFKIEPTGGESDLIIRWRQDDSEQYEASDLTYIGGPSTYGLHYTLIFQNDGAYLLEHDRDNTYIRDLKNKGNQAFPPNDPSADKAGDLI